ncbi:MAG: sialidase family protein [Acidobacteriota bacterium]|nr:sialidase family protein [Acidobacteriota bacterium]
MRPPNRRRVRPWLLAATAPAASAALLFTGIPAPRNPPRPDVPPLPGGGGKGIPDKPVLTFDPPSPPARTDGGAGGTNRRAHQDSSGRDQNETSIAIHPNDPNNIVGGANDAREGSWAAEVYASHDGGRTFSDGVMPFRAQPNQGDPTLAFCGDGTVLYGYLDYVGSFSPHRLIVSHSNDGGDTWSDDRDGAPDIDFTRSTDGGPNWETPYRVNDDAVGNGRDQFFPWMAVDDKGLLHLMWHDRRHDSTNDAFPICIATSRDGGESFDRNLRGSDSPSKGSLTGFLGDYAALAAGGGKFVPLWSDLRAGTGEEDVYIEVEPAFDYDIVADVLFDADKQTLHFADQEPRLGDVIVYDLVLGDVADVAATDPWTGAQCVAEDLAAPPATVPDLPDPGRALYVRLRAQGPRGHGSFGSASAHPDTRDSLDDAPPCGL